MNGVEILAIEEVAVAWKNFNWTNFWIALIAFAAAALIISIFAWIYEEDFTAGLLVFVLSTVFFGGLISGTVGIVSAEPTEYKTQYKVTIDESVSMLEFNEKYEILDQEGRIYTVVERD